MGMVKTITTTISDEYHKAAKDNKISWHDALSKGIQAMLQGDRTLAEIEMLKQGNLKLQQKLSEISMELRSLQNGIR